MTQCFHVLLVEDSPSDALLLREALAEVIFFRFHVEWVDRLSRAIECLKRQPFDIILLDLNLPDDQGLDTLLHIREQAQSIPIVVFTGLNDHSLGIRLIQAGAQDYLVKGQLQGDSLARSIRHAVERKRIEEALKEAERRKDDFLAMLAHELRNPLAPIRNAVEALKRPELASGQVRMARDIIDRQLTQLTHLVDDLLDISRITHGKVTLKREGLDLSDVIAQAVEASRPLMEARRHELILILPSGSLHIEGDFVRLSQVVSNLLDNAAKYTENGGRIALSLVVEDRHAVIRVQDNGIGIAPDTLPQVFALFTQAERSLNRAQGGLGIGLTLVKQLVEMHGGRVEAHSQGLGRGCEFVVRLPLSNTAMPPAPEEWVGDSA
jgi:signal transduction histidine kinase